MASPGYRNLSVPDALYKELESIAHDPELGFQNAADVGRTALRQYAQWYHERWVPERPLRAKARAQLRKA